MISESKRYHGTSEFRISDSGLRIGKTVLPSSYTLGDWIQILNEHPRVLPANPAAPAWREVCVFDEIGIYVLREMAANLTLSVNFVWDVKASPYAPRCPFSGCVKLHDLSLDREASTENLSHTRSLAFSKLPGRRYLVALGLYHVSMKFSAGDFLSYLEFSYSSVGMPDQVIGDRIRKN